jgi:hypothetical protein
MTTKRSKPRKRRQSTVAISNKSSNRPGQTELDPMDNYRESGYLQGFILKEIFTGKLRTNNVYFLIIMFALGTLSTVTGHYVYVGTADTNWGMAMLCMLPMAAFGLALLYNFSASSWLLYRHSALGNWLAKRQKQPKYRKSHMSRK